LVSTATGSGADGGTGETMNQLPQLIIVFSYLSLLTVGGGMAAFPELKYLAVDVHHWLSTKQLIHLYSLGQMAPGPNMMMVAAIGDRVDGIAGAVVTACAFFLPTALLTYRVGRIWERLGTWPWRQSIQRGLAPVSIGLLLGGCISVAMEALSGWINVAMAVVVFVILLRYKINPALLVLCAALIGLFVFR
jgi:chromate transporter